MLEAHSPSKYSNEYKSGMRSGGERIGAGTLITYQGWRPKKNYEKPSSCKHIAGKQGLLILLLDPERISWSKLLRL